MLSNDLLREVLLEQAQKLESLEKTGWVERELLAKIMRFVPLKQIVVLTGVRRCGKSVLLSQITKKFFQGGFYYVNFEDERLAGFGLQDFNLLYEVCLQLFGVHKAFFLDEIQNVPGWEKWVRRMHDDSFKFFLTGSNARLLSKELGTLLTGRHIQVSVFPFSFLEFLAFQGIKVEKNDVYLTKKRAEIAKAFLEFVKSGGFPEFVKDNQGEILQEYFNSIIQRDIVERHHIKNIRGLKELARHLITNSGNLTTYNQLKNLTLSKSANTSINYVSYLEDAYLIFRVPFFSYSLKKQNANPFKVYSIDQGMRNAMAFTFSPDYGRVYENIVALQLKRKNAETYYWKNTLHEEVDFVIKNGKKAGQLIQVCYNLLDPNTKKREVSALLKAGKELKCSNLLIITSDYGAIEKEKNRKIQYIPLWKWLLQ